VLLDLLPSLAKKSLKALSHIAMPIFRDSLKLFLKENVWLANIMEIVVFLQNIRKFMLNSVNSLRRIIVWANCMRDASERNSAKSMTVSLPVMI
jgi:hypothetical protein